MDAGGLSDTGALIVSGSHTPGVSADDFGLPPYTALRYERPAAGLLPYVASYAVLDSDPPEPTIDYMLPSAAQIWMVFTPRPVHLRIGNRRYPELPSAALVGPTSRAVPAGAHGGVSVVIDVSPVGWARLFKTPAADVADRMVPLDTMMPAATVDALVGSLRHIDRGRAVKARLDEVLSAHIGPRHPDEAAVDRLMAALMDDTTTSAAEMAERVGVDHRRLRILARRHFGFTPMTLLLRTRFLKALLPMIDPRSGVDIGAVPARYHDASHFARDARRFVGMSHRRFLATPKPYCEAALRARVAVFGTSLSTLDYTSIAPQAGGAGG